MSLLSQIEHRQPYEGPKSKQESLAGSVMEGMKKLWGSFSEMLKRLPTQRLAGIMPALTGMLTWFGIEKKAETPSENHKEALQQTREKTTEPEPKKNLEALRQEIETEKKAKIEAPKPFNLQKIRSNPYEVGSNGITLCSLTAKKNLEMLCPGKKFISINPRQAAKDIQNIKEEVKAGKFRLEEVIPTGNADDIEQFYLDTHAPIIRGNAEEKIRQLDLSGKTVCDIVTFGSTRFGHRSAGFKGTDGQWYVLDPYRYARRTEPILFKEYVEKYGTDIKFVVPIDTSGHNQYEPLAESLSTPDRILSAADELIQKKVRGESCWDWADKVYIRAGLPLSKRKAIYDVVKNYEGTDCGQQHAEDKELDKLQPGDWLFINNKNTKDAHGNHSVIFLGWVDRANQIAKTASSPGSGGPGNIWNHTDFKKMPVTHITKPA